MSLSLCMIVKNEENNLPRCLDSVKGIVDEMIIVDTGSTDSTVKIAEGYGAKVYYFPWNDSFSDARNCSLQFASCDWILLMDADDELESSHKQSILDLVDKNEADAYFFQTVCYIGDEPGFDAVSNLNVRLIKNHMGYYFTNPIHEQIYSNIKRINPSAKILNEPIRIFHYGYLNKNIVEHDKRARNIRILEKELEENPDYGFALFNLGNEYFALGNYDKAIEYYTQSYSSFDPQQGFSSKLVFKMTNCLSYMGKHDDASRLIDEGLRFYPCFTDLEHLRALSFFGRRKYSQAIRALNKCIEMGEAPFNLSIIMGAGSYRSYVLLGECYYELEDYDAAEENYIKAMSGCKNLSPAIVKLIKILSIKKIEPKLLTRTLEDMRQYYTENFDSIVFEGLFHEKHYKLALAYIKKFEAISGPTPHSSYFKSLCKLILKQYRSCYSTIEAIKPVAEYQTRAICSQAVCKTMEKKYSQTSRLLSANEQLLNDPMAKVYYQFNQLMESGEKDVLTDDVKESAIYTEIIFDLLKIILRMQEFEIFEKALNLLNSVNDTTVLLRLAKLYYNEEFFGLAYQEFLRSIKEFGLIDAEGGNMLYKLKLKGL